MYEHVEIPKRTVFYCAECDANPNATPAAHARDTGHRRFLYVTVPDLLHAPKGAVLMTGRVREP